MGWERGCRYYTRSRRENGRVVREYVGRGENGCLAALLDTEARAEKIRHRKEVESEVASIEELDAPLNELNALADAAVRDVLEAAGFRQHNRGEWRKRRGEHQEKDCAS